MANSIDPQLTVWWGRSTPQEGAIGQWQIGPSKLWLTRYPKEWRIAHYQLSDDPLVATIKYVSKVTADAIHSDAQVFRYGYNDSPKALTLQPVLADRPMVIKPTEPLQIQSGEEVTMYVMTPVWIRIVVGEALSALQDVPSFRPSDTWFGSNTIEGELCYASSTLGRLRLEDLPVTPNRAITPIKIRNRSKSGLLLERVKLPVQYLALYKNNNELWTQTITLIREQNSDNAAIQIQKGPPNEVSSAQKLSDPHLKVGNKLIVRAFSRLFSGN